MKRSLPKAFSARARSRKRFGMELRGGADFQPFFFGLGDLVNYHVHVLGSKVWKQLIYSGLSNDDLVYLVEQK
ncbi:hypothetical protein HanXRQr2_Chr11g0518921 [Helianthus annuus]|uniref:Uncharacterized protein n=2 Tax=Helianthus annuus TaxID=4232 RepID=A0A9K3HTQ6_HELAN|nr:hypothetical protein HanXRQr2_Chr11g0518921 [Helianthus annuus]KAJ0877435.1 hypothetical protein HanPSC8_Chr11g0500111 [Helianthus annuus]